MQNVSIGRIVHYVAHTKRGDRIHMPAVVVRVWGSSDVINLTFFPDWENDYDRSDGVAWATSVRYSEEKENGTWHWPEYVPDTPDVVQQPTAIFVPTHNPSPPTLPPNPLPKEDKHPITPANEHANPQAHGDPTVQHAEEVPGKGKGHSKK